MVQIDCLSKDTFYKR